MLDTLISYVKQLFGPPIQVTTQQSVVSSQPPPTQVPNQAPWLVNYHPPFQWNKWKIPYQQPLLTPSNDSSTEMR